MYGHIYTNNTDSIVFCFVGDDHMTEIPIFTIHREGLNQNTSGTSGDCFRQWQDTMAKAS